MSVALAAAETESSTYEEGQNRRFRIPQELREFGSQSSREWKEAGFLRVKAPTNRALRPALFAIRPKNGDPTFRFPYVSVLFPSRASKM